MHQILNFTIYFFLFLTLYFQIFMLVTFIEERFFSRKKVKSVRGAYVPSVSIIVPAWNEERTIGGTLKSLLALDYPKDKLNILVVDDGSKDSTLLRAREFEHDSRIKVLTKENGGKYTALNLALTHIETDLVGCLDADSFVDAGALWEIVAYFENLEVMAVTPMIRVHEPRGIVQRMQNIEYILGALIRKVFGYLNALYVTPGPFSIYRREVFKKIGDYKHAHHTEDLEMALRMQSHRLRIENAERAVVYTVAPKTVRVLFKQRVRWIHGFLENARDYSHLLFRRSYGNLGVFSLPFAVVSIFTAIFFAGYIFYIGGARIYEKYIEVAAVGVSHYFNWSFSFDWFFLKTDPQSIMKYMIAVLMLAMIVGGVWLVRIKKVHTIALDTVFFLALYGLIAPFWLLRSVYGVAFSKKTRWR